MAENTNIVDAPVEEQLGEESLNDTMSDPVIAERSIINMNLLNATFFTPSKSKWISEMIEWLRAKRATNDDQLNKAA